MLWSLFIDSISDKLRISCTILAFVIPYAVYKINRYLHEVGDPPWKKEDAQKAEEKS